MIAETNYLHRVPVYYEDTDFSGVVYHANYLKFFERAREHAIGQDRLVQLWDEHGLGFVVYHLEIKFNDGALFGETLEIRSHFTMDGKYRMTWHQEAWRPQGTKAAVSAAIQLVCVNRKRWPQPIPLELLAEAQ